MVNLIYAFMIPFFLTMVMVPILMRAAGPLQLIDRPDGRKHHLGEVPRCGGIAIVISAFMPAVMWMPLNPIGLSFVAAVAIVFLIGLWDDRYQLSPKWKLAGQFLAALILMQGGFVIKHFPLLGLDPVSDLVAYPLTALFIVGVTNAINMSDGLDGLAAGCALITLCMIAILAFQVEGFTIMIVALALMGGIFGFLRFNTHPATVFLGDAGSLFLGFIVAALTVRLIGYAHSALSPALPALLLGIPLLDLLWVIALRVRAGQPLFSPDRRHFHYRLALLGFRHHEAVGLIYILHALLVSTAFFLTFRSDLLILLVFMAISSAIIGSYYAATQLGWRLHPEVDEAQYVERRSSWLRQLPWLSVAAVRALAYGIAVFIVVGAAFAVEIPRDFAFTALMLIFVLITAVIFLAKHSALFVRFGLYITCMLVCYLLVPLPAALWFDDFAINLYCLVLLAILLIAVRATRRDVFHFTPHDLLVVFLALIVPNLTAEFLGQFPLGELVLRLLVLFYVAEFVLSSGPVGKQDEHRHWVLRIGTILSLAIMAGRAFV